jgi:hypothetical protein
MDRDNEFGRAKWLALSGLAFVISCFVVYDEVVYLVRGRVATANVTSAYEVTTRRFGVVTGKSLTVEYTFTEPDGTPRSGSDTVSASWVLPETGGIPVRYTPGAEGRSRLAGHFYWAGVVFFFVALLVMGVFGYRLWREAKEAYEPKKPKRGP